jgi:lipopolysaccharide export LptBFGC system permease protein LptF
MYPETNQPIPAPIDYLNQIAPAPQKPGVNKAGIAVVVIGILLVLALVVGFLMFISGGSNSPKATTQTLAARLQATQEVSDSSQATIKSSQLRSINSTLKVILTNANRDIATPLAANGIDIEKLDKKIVAKEKADPITADLEDARLNAVFDDTYAREMSFKLTTVTILMDQINGKTKSASMKSYLLKTKTDLQPIKQQLDEFNSTTR